MSTSKRIYAIDVLRGITVAAMIVVNNAGGKLSYSCLQHSEWCGMTLCDMVFPSFLFIVGLTAFISLSKGGFKFTPQLFYKILRRTVIILLIGWGIHWFEHICKADFLPFGTLRLTGVLPRIALCYFFVSIIALTLSRKSILWLTVGLLAVYSLILALGNGYANDLTNILSRIDRWILGEGHLYTKRPIDPEGVMGTVSSVAHTLIGFLCGAVLVNRNKALELRLLDIMVIGFGLYVLGLALDLGMPFNKRIWSPSFVLASCGLVAMALAAISYITDVHGKKALFRPFDVFGVNPLFLYVFSELAAIVLSVTHSKSSVYLWINNILPDPYLASLVYSLAFVLVMWLIGYPLYRNKIYIKI